MSLRYLSLYYQCDLHFSNPYLFYLGLDPPHSSSSIWSSLDQPSLKWLLCNLVWVVQSYPWLWLVNLLWDGNITLQGYSQSCRTACRMTSGHHSVWQFPIDIFPFWREWLVTKEPSALWKALLSCEWENVLGTLWISLWEYINIVIHKATSRALHGFAWYNSCGMEKCPLAVNGTTGRNGLWRAFLPVAGNLVTLWIALLT